MSNNPAPDPDFEEDQLSLDQHYWDLTGAPTPDLASDPRTGNANLRHDPVSLDDNAVPVTRVPLPQVEAPHSSSAHMAAAAFTDGDFALANAHASQHLESSEIDDATVAIRIVLPPLNSALIFRGSTNTARAIHIVVGEAAPDLDVEAERVLYLNNLLLTGDPLHDYYPGVVATTYEQTLEHAALALLASRDGHVLAARRHAWVVENSDSQISQALSRKMLTLLVN
mgnify:CR=1 FL=1